MTDDVWLKSLGVAELEQTLRVLKQCEGEHRGLMYKVRKQIKLRKGSTIVKWR